MFYGDQLVSKRCDDGHRRLDERPVSECQRDVQQRKRKETLKRRREEVGDPLEVRRREDDKVAHVLRHRLEEERVLRPQRVRNRTVHGENALDIRTVKLGRKEVDELLLTREEKQDSEEDVEGLLFGEELQQAIDDVVHPLHVAHLLVVQVDGDLIRREIRDYQHAEHLVVFLGRDVHSLQVCFDHVQIALGNRRLLAVDDGEVAVLETVEHPQTQRPVKTADLVRNGVLEQTKKNGMNGLRERGPLLLLDPMSLVENDIVPNGPARSSIVNVSLQ